ncbi:hypothetical protein [Paenibacillus amylolyticus]|uniref:hypothetical protein n=1 Tax=Paenibacillus amylolyticus TaxID=1451 RepID=UPI0033995839
MQITEIYEILSKGMSGDEFTLPDVSLLNNELHSLIQTFISGRLVLDDAFIQMQDESSILIWGKSKVNILGLTEPLVVLEFVLVADKPECTIDIKLPDGWEPESVATWLRRTLIVFQSSYKMHKSELFFASADNLPFPKHLSRIHPAPTTKGTYFFSKMDIQGEPISLLESIFGKLSPLDLNTLITDNFTGPIEVKVPNDLPVIGPLQPSNPRIIIKTDSLQFRTKLKLDIQNDSLYFDGGGNVLANGTFELTFALNGVSKQGQDKADTTGWVDPFGFFGFTIQKFGIGIALGTTGTEISLSGEITIGEEGSADQIIMEAGGKFINGQVPSALIASLRASSSSQDGIPLSRLVEYFTMMPLGDFVLLQEVKIKDLTMYVVSDPNGFIPPSDPGKTYRGLAMNAELSLFGLACKAKIEFQQNRGVKAEGELGIIDLSEVLRITDETGTRGPLFIIDSTQTSELTAKQGYIYLSAKVSLFGLTQSVTVKAAQNAFEFALSFSVPGLSDFQISCLLSGNDSFEGHADLTFDFPNENIELKVNEIVIATFSLGTKVKGKLNVSLKQDTFLLEVAATLELPGLPILNMNLTLTEAVTNLEGIRDEILRFIRREVEEKFNPTLNDPLALVKLLHLDGWELDKISEKLKNLNHSAFAIANGFSKMLDLNDVEVTRALKGVFDVTDVSKALVELWAVRPADMAKILNITDYSISEITKGIEVSVISKYGTSSLKRVGKALKTQFPKMDDITDGINAISSGVDDEKLAKLFKDIDFSPEEIASYARENWDWDENKVVEVFVNQLKIKPDKVIKVLHETGFPTPDLKKFPHIDWPDLSDGTPELPNWIRQPPNPFR